MLIRVKYFILMLLFGSITGVIKLFRFVMDIGKDHDAEASCNRCGRRKHEWKNCKRCGNPAKYRKPLEINF